MSTMDNIEYLERQAALLERQATEREETAAMRYGGGSGAYMRSLVTADEYRKKARALREKAELRRQ